MLRRQLPLPGCAVAEWMGIPGGDRPSPAKSISSGCALLNPKGITRIWSRPAWGNPLALPRPCRKRASNSMNAGVHAIQLRRGLMPMWIVVLREVGTHRHRGDEPHAGTIISQPAPRWSVGSLALSTQHHERAQ
jgi:hypothetical protein